MFIKNNYYCSMGNSVATLAPTIQPAQLPIPVAQLPINAEPDEPIQPEGAILPIAR